MACEVNILDIKFLVKWSTYYPINLYNNISLQSKYHPFLNSQPYRMWKSQSQCKRASVWHSCLHLYLSRYFLQIKCVDWNPDWHMYNIVYQSMLHTRCNTLKIFEVEKSIFIVHHIYHVIYYNVNHWRWKLIRLFVILTFQWISRLYNLNNHGVIKRC